MKRVPRAGASALAVVLAAVSCGEAPTKPKETGVRFLYVEGQTVVVTGESTRLSAFEMHTGQTVSNVTARARWSEADPLIASVQQGLLQALSPGRTTIRVWLDAAQGDTDVHVIVPATNAPDVRGQYVGTVTFTSNNRIAGDGPNPFRDQIGRPFLLELTVTGQSNASVTGTLLLIDRTVGPIRGYVDSTGEVNFSGTLGIAGEPLARMIRRLRIRLDGARITGSGEADVAMINAFGPQLLKQTFEIDASLK